MRLLNLIRALLVLWIVSTAACLAPVHRLPSPAVRAPTIGEQSDWTLHGRLALSNGRDGGSGQLTWRQSPQRAELRFIGALGRGSWRLQVTEHGAELESAAIGLVRDADVETLLRDQLGWELPVDSMRYWVSGMLNPGLTGTDVFDRRGRLLRLRQAGWLVVYDGWIDVQGTWLPRKVTATRGGNQIRILVKKWTLSG